MAEADDTTTKRCPKCEQTKPLDGFGCDKRRRDGLKCWCKSCHNEQGRKAWAEAPPEARQAHNAKGRAWREANPERARELIRNWQKRNPEKTKANCTQWREKNRDHHNARAVLDYWKHRLKRLASMAERRRKNPDRDRARAKRYRAANREVFAQHSRNYKARKRGAAGLHTSADIAAILKAQNGRCAYCRKRLGTSFHVDHIVPLSKRGTNNKSNLQLTCSFCNISKKDQDPLDFARKTGRLL